MASPLTHETPIDEQTALRSLGALSQTLRLRIFRALVGGGPQDMTPSVLGSTLDAPASTLSFHLKELMYAGMVSQERDGRNLIYRPSLDRMNALIVYLTAHCCQASDDEACDVGAPPGCATC